ncbi:YopX family protein [Streptococcus sanguinis]|uniref:YopX family protein n=1 Tax=Streptococcus sanguinis TaxID=1305 RepID=UPI000F66CD7C|nr:YopX family protein [Streptococcus sanguinis]RSI51548.1 YopX protein [Streptococcus sanguinis]DAY23735.1 MAG TPA: YopX protein [Caudoviricetes sp.]
MIQKFRAWNKATKEMHEADDIVSLNFEKKQICVKTLFFGQLNYYDFDDIVSMQSTGLKDKNGNEIFEGDILGSKDGILDSVVEFRSDLGMWTTSLIRYNNFERLCNVASERKIIGNIYKNPELLK